MSLKNIVSFGSYTPPAPQSFKVSYSDKIKDYDMENGDITRYTTRNALRQFDIQFSVSKSNAENIKAAVQTGGELTVTYNETQIYMYLTAYSETVVTISGKGIHSISITLKECRRAT